MDRLVSVQEISQFKIFRLRSGQVSSPSDFVQVQFQKSVQLKKIPQLIAIKRCCKLIF